MVSAAPDAVPRSRAEAKEATRRALIRAAREAMAEQGLEGPSLDAICERAGFTRGAFYVHFRNRDALVEAVMEEALREVVDGVVGRPGGGPAGDLASTVARYVAVARFVRRVGEAGPPGVRFHQILEAARRTPRIGQLLRRVLADARARLERSAAAAQATGRARSDAAPPELATLLLLLALGVIAADELALPLDLDATRDALLGLIAPGAPSPA